MFAGGLAALLGFAFGLVSPVSWLIIVAADAAFAPNAARFRNKGEMMPDAQQSLYAAILVIVAFVIGWM